MELNVNEIMELEGLKWEVRDLHSRILKHNEERKALKDEKKTLMKKIKETEERYAQSDIVG